MAAQLAKNLAKSNFRRCSLLCPAIQSRSYSEIGNPLSVGSIVDKVIGPSKKQGVKSVTVTGPSDVACITGVPEEHIKGRLVRIYRTPKNAMQSGTHNVDQWEMEFETRERWENPLMGWSSSGDPVSNIKLQFSDRDEAISHAEKHGFEYYIEAEKKVNPKVKSYGFNFSWNKRTRVSTK